MHVRQALAGSLLPSADAEVLLSRILGQDRTWLLAHSEYVLSDTELTQWGEWLARRRRFEPVAYILGEQEFRGRMFAVDKRVLIPRPATEALVTLALQFLEDPKEQSLQADEGIAVFSRRTPQSDRQAAAVVDIGTGSGAIAISMALERPDLRISATDVSADALDVARDNAERHGVLNRMTFLQGNGLEPIRMLQEPFLLLCNPPYIPAGTRLMKDVEAYEPHMALFGGADGAELIRTVIQGAAEHPHCVGLVMECETGQMP